MLAHLPRGVRQSGHGFRQVIRGGWKFGCPDDDDFPFPKSLRRTLGQAPADPPPTPNHPADAPSLDTSSTSPSQS